MCEKHVYIKIILYTILRYLKISYNVISQYDVVCWSVPWIQRPVRHMPCSWCAPRLDLPFSGLCTHRLDTLKFNDFQLGVITGPSGSGTLNSPWAREQSYHGKTTRDNHIMTIWSQISCPAGMHAVTWGGPRADCDIMYIYIWQCFRDVQSMSSWWVKCFLQMPFSFSYPVPDPEVRARWQGTSLDLAPKSPGCSEITGLWNLFAVMFEPG